MFIRMKRDFAYPVEGQKGVTRTLPAGWSGEVDDVVGKAAVKAGSAVTQGKTKKARRSQAGGEPSAAPEGEGGGEGQGEGEGGGAEGEGPGGEGGQ